MCVHRINSFFFVGVGSPTLNFSSCRKPFRGPRSIDPVEIDCGMRLLRNVLTGCSPSLVDHAHVKVGSVEQETNNCAWEMPKCVRVAHAIRWRNDDHQVSNIDRQWEHPGTDE